MTFHKRKKAHVASPAKKEATSARSSFRSITGGMVLRQDPLDLSFWSFLTFLHHGIEEVDRHLL